MQNHRAHIVVTGLGAISPLGNDVATFWDGIRHGRSAMAPVTLFDTSSFDTHFAAEVKVRLRGGTTLGAKVDQPAGRTSANPLSAEQLREKFENCAARVLPAA